MPRTTQWSRPDKQRAYCEVLSATVYRAEHRTAVQHRSPTFWHQCSSALHDWCRGSRITTKVPREVLPGYHKRSLLSAGGPQQRSTHAKRVQSRMTKCLAPRRPITSEGDHGNDTRCVNERRSIQWSVTYEWAEVRVHCVSDFKKSVHRSTTKREDRMVC